MAPKIHPNDPPDPSTDPSTSTAVTATLDPLVVESIQEPTAAENPEQLDTAAPAS